MHCCQANSVDIHIEINIQTRSLNIHWYTAKDCNRNREYFKPLVGKIFQGYPKEEKKAQKWCRIMIGQNFMKRQCDWLKGVTWPKVAWHPNEIDYSCCDFAVRNPPYYTALTQFDRENRERQYFRYSLQPASAWNVFSLLIYFVFNIYLLVTGTSNLYIFLKSEHVFRFHCPRPQADARNVMFASFHGNISSQAIHLNHSVKM